MFTFCKKHWRKAAAVIMIAGLAVAVVMGALFLEARLAPDAGDGLRIFYFNPDTAQLEPMGVTLTVVPEMPQIEAMLGHLYRTPRDAGLTGLWPEGLWLAGLTFYDDLVGVAFPPEYRSVPPLDEALFRTALTLTLLELPFVERVLIWVYGEGNLPDMPFDEWVRLWVDDDEESDLYWDTGAFVVETSATVSNNPFISPRVMGNRLITLYFVCPSGEGLVTETFEDEYLDLHRMAMFKLQQLIAGPSDDYALRVIPPETRVRRAHLDMGGSLYVDLSGDFESRFIGSTAMAGLMLQSIVNTLTLPGNNQQTVRQVFFLINSQRQESFHGVGGFDQAFVYDHDLVLAEYDDYYDDDPYGYAVQTGYRDDE